MIKLKTLIPAAFAAVFAMTGCIGNFNENDFISVQDGIMESVTVDNNIAEDLRIIQAGSMKTESGVEIVSIRGRLKRSGFVNFVFDSYKPVSVSYKFTWYDAEGNAITGDSAYSWKTIQLFPGEEFSCVSCAPSKDVKKMTFTVKAGEETAAQADEAFRPQPAGEMLKKELPDEIREGKTTTTKEIKAKTDEVEKKNKVLKEVSEKVDNGKSACLCGCANGEDCYCPEGSACPNAGKK